MAAKPIPDGYHSITPYLIVDDGAKALDFYAKAFGAKELFRFPAPDGKVMHAEFKIGDSVMMLADAASNVHDPKHYGGSSVGILLYVENVDAMFNQAVAAGATVERPVQDQLYGDRSGGLIDPFGHRWTLATHIEDVSIEEVNRRYASMKPD
ncbi:MAG: VOC family protein [Phycisphaerae bacterium]|nr:VOC family protein [Phycisphaerae bacterium]